MSFVQESQELLNDFQRQILEECLEKKTGCLSLPKGSGKTLLSLVIGVSLTDKAILVVCAKSLISSWIHEIDKFFEGTLSYKVFHRDYLKKESEWFVDDKTDVFIVTPDLLASVYKKNHLSKDLITEEINNIGLIKRYTRATRPLLHDNSGRESLFSYQWGCLIVDECQLHMTITTAKAKALCCLATDHTWLCSGDPLTTGKGEQMLGFFLLVNANTSDHLSGVKKYIRSNQFTRHGGAMKYMVYREKNRPFESKEIELVRHIVTHQVEIPEKKIYLIFKDLIKEFNDQTKEIKAERREKDDRQWRTRELKMLSSTILSLITYLRQSLICPIAPLARAALNSSETDFKEKISNKINSLIDSNGIRDWLDDPEAVFSSRLRKMMSLLEKDLSEDKVVIFCSYRTSIFLIKHYLKSLPRDSFSIASSMNTKDRKKVIDDFRNSGNGIMLLTYSIGSTGLNLQFCNHSIFLDLDWSPQTISQAECRTYRMGQTSNKVHCYYLTSGTGVENAVLGKHVYKKKVVGELMKGQIKTKFRSSSAEKMIEMVMTEDNIKLFKTVTSDETE